MSQTHQPQRRDQLARDPTDVYDIVIHHSPERCSTCHARIRDKHEVNAEESHDGLGSGNKPTAVLERAGEGELGHDCEDVDDYGAVKDYQTRTFCGECGRPTGRGEDDPAPLSTMLDRVPALVAALKAEGLRPDVDTIYTVVRHLRSIPDYDSRIDDIWRAATAQAIR